MFHPNLKLFADELDIWLRQRFKYRSQIAHCGISNTIHVRTVKVSLYLRLIQHTSSLWPSHTLVIARIEFREQNQGHGTAFLKFLVCQSKRINYANIGVEAAGDDEGIQRYCQRFFLKHPESSTSKLNWIAPIDHISSTLESDG